MLTINDVQTSIGTLPRVQLATLPTPLQYMENLSRLWGTTVYMKRDDLTGLAFGGNKTRMFEFLLAVAQQEGADCVIAGAQAQSNYCRQMAAACSKLGLDCYLPLRRIRGEKDNPVQGNLFLDLLVGAHVALIDEDMNGQQQTMRALTEQLKKAGRKPFMARITEDHVALESIGYVECFLEIASQSKAAGFTPTHVYVSAYDATQSGLELAVKALGMDVEIIGIAPGTWEQGGAPVKIAKYANDAAKLLGIKVEVTPDDIANTEEYAGAYGYPTPEGLESIQVVARAEGVILEPVYTAKAMAGLMDHIRKGQLGSKDKIVFLHTGGTPAIFAYTDELREKCKPLADSVERFLADS